MNTDDNEILVPLEANLYEYHHLIEQIPEESKYYKSAFIKKAKLLQRFTANTVSESSLEKLFGVFTSPHSFYPVESKSDHLLLLRIDSALKAGDNQFILQLVTDILSRVDLLENNFQLTKQRS